jgi:hypothetical protein
MPHEEVNVSMVQDSEASPEAIAQHEEEMIAKVDGEPQQQEEEEESTSEPSTNDKEGDLGVSEDKDTKEEEEEEHSKNEEEEKEGDETPEKPTEVFTETEWKDYVAEFQESGELSEDSIQKIVAKGLPEGLVRDYLAGLQAQQTIHTQQVEKTTQEIFDMTGGQESYQAMQEWAKETLTAEEKQTFNDAVYSGNPALAKLAVQGLHSRFIQSSPGAREINLLSGTGEGNVGNAQGAYNSWAEVRKDMGRPEYKKDPAFQAQVRAKLARSSRL